MFDHLKKWEEEQMGGTPEGVPQLASLAERAGRGPQSPPPADAESEASAFQPEGDESSGAEPFAGRVGPPRLRPMGIAPRTLRHWQQRSREGQLKPYPRGRPARRSPRWLRNQVVQLLCLTGPSVGTPTLEATFSTMPRSELKDILRRFRRVWQYQNQRLIHRLRWHHPGTVWAVDHVQPDQPIDGV